MRILITGAAGFIGYSLTARLLHDGYKVYGLDSMQDSCCPNLQQTRLRRLNKHKRFRFFKLDLNDFAALEELFSEHRFSHIIHLAARAGAKRSLIFPVEYARSNLDSVISLLEACRKYPIKQFLFSSSHSACTQHSARIHAIPDNPSFRTDQPVSLYAATKRSGELLLHSYSHLFSIPSIVLRLPAVYGPWGRPDSEIFSLARAVLDDKTLDLTSKKQDLRSLIHIDDVTRAFMACLKSDKNSIPPSAVAPYEMHELHTQEVPVLQILDYLKLYLKIESGTGSKTKPARGSDVNSKYHTTLHLNDSFFPQINIDAGLKSFSEWFLKYYN